MSLLILLVRQELVTFIMLVGGAFLLRSKAMKSVIVSILVTMSIPFLIGQEAKGQVSPFPDSLTTIAILPLKGKGISNYESETVTERLKMAHFILAS